MPNIMTFKVLDRYVSVDMTRCETPYPAIPGNPPTARRNGVPVFRVNRHHRKRAWQTRDAVVESLERFFQSLWRRVFTVRGASLKDAMLEFNAILYGALSQPSPLLGTEDAPGLFRVKGRWSPSYLIRWKNGRGRYRGTLAPEYTPVHLP